MALPPGVRLGPYEIQATLGAGGMGEVYRARDVRLDRLVAIKVLPSSLAERPDRRARFQSEARIVSSLSHPHICALLDVGEHDGQHFLVMEYLDGETLDDRLTRGPLPLPDLLRHGSEIAGALSHAHRHHVVHRDLKPSNVMLTASGATLLDFGLAKLQPAEDLVTPAGSTVSVIPGRLTGEGALLGTFQYMAPEQLEGKEADPRTDVFALGVVLYEMATGRAAFQGKSQASLIAAILTAQPPAISTERRDLAGAAAGLDHVVERCLAKKPDDRWQSAHDVGRELEWIAQGGAVRAAPVRRWSRALWTAAAMALVALVTWRVAGVRAPADAITRFVVSLPAGTTIGGLRNATRVAVSPDGRQLAFVGTTAARDELWVQPFDSTVPRRLEGTVGARSPFWSPDSRYLGFYATGTGELRRAEVSGGPPRTICVADVIGLPVWGRDGTILFAVSRQGISAVSSEGGEPRSITQVDKSRRELNHMWPSLLPDGRTFLFTATALDAAGRRATPVVYAAALDSPERTEIARVHSRMVYAAPGRVLYVQEGSLLAQEFDVDGLRLRGEPRQLVEGLDYFRSTGSAAFAVSDGGGALSYYGDAGPLALEWFDRAGMSLGRVWNDQRFANMRIAPDGARAALEVIDPRLGTSDIWLYDLERNVPTRFTADLNDETMPVWSPDGRRIMFGSDRGTGLDAASDFFVKSADGTGPEDVVFIRTGFETGEDWSPDGQSFAYVAGRQGSSNDIWILPLTPNATPKPFLQTRFDEWGPRFSPDGAWMAFVSDESGTAEVYVAPFTGDGARMRVSTGGGGAPRWRRDGRELFYLSSDGRTVMAVPIALGSAPRAGRPAALFSLAADVGFRSGARNVGFDAAPDGQRFLLSTAGGAGASRITVVLNWTAMLRP